MFIIHSSLQIKYRHNLKKSQDIKRFQTGLLLESSLNFRLGFVYFKRSLFGARKSDRDDSFWVTLIFPPSLLLYSRKNLIPSREKFRKKQRAISVNRLKSRFCGLNVFLVSQAISSFIKGNINYNKWILTL